MAAESPVLGQIQHIPSSTVSTCPSSEPHPPATIPADPLQGLVQEMALSAVIQKHGSSVPSTTHSSHSNNGAIMNNYMLQTSSSMSHSDQLYTAATTAPQPTQTSGVMLGGANGNVPQGFILSSAQGNGPMSLLAHPQASPVLQGTQLALPQLAGQLHEVGSTPAPNVVQFTPVCCYEGTSSAQPSPAVDRSAMLQSNFVG